MKEYKYPEIDTSWWGRKRDRMAARIAKLAFTHIATPRYRVMMTQSILYGVKAAQGEAYNERTISFEEMMSKNRAD